MARSMTRTRARLAALERQARVDPTVTVWRQDTAGTDRFTSSKHDGLVLTRAQLDARPEPAGGLRILGERVPAGETAPSRE